MASLVRLDRYRLNRSNGPGTRLGMDADTSKALAAFGFLTVLESAEHGWFGGYLVLSPQGRPLEFRCSTPVAPTRAQEILYGPTLRPCLFTEVIGQSLLKGAELPVEVILTDQLDVLPLASMRREEVLLVEHISAPRDEVTPHSTSNSSLANRGVAFELSGCLVTAASTSIHGDSQLAAMLEPLASNVFLLEPFDRIRAALLEMQTAASDAAEWQDERTAA
jgi:hypothetical protein